MSDKRLQNLKVDPLLVHMQKLHNFTFSSTETWVVFFLIFEQDLIDVLAFSDHFLAFACVYSITPLPHNPSSPHLKKQKINMHKGI